VKNKKCLNTAYRSRMRGKRWRRGGRKENRKEEKKGREVR